MGLFSGFRKLINKQISLSPYQKNDMVIFVRLKNGCLKVNTEVVVDEGYCAVLTHYDSICDILSVGTHKFDANGMPLLSKHAKPIKTSTGYVAPKELKADLYYINLSVFEHQYFKTADKVIALDGKDKVKLKFDGTFNTRVADPLKLIKTLLSELAVIKEGRALKEICALTGETVARILNENLFHLQQYVDRDTKITILLNDYINKTMSQFGVENTNVVLNQLYLKQQKGAENKVLTNGEKKIEFNQDKEEKDKEQKSDINEKIFDLNNIKGLEEAINNVGKKEVIYVKPVSVSQEEIKQREERQRQEKLQRERLEAERNQSPIVDTRDAYDRYGNQFTTRQSGTDQPEPQILITPARNEMPVSDRVMDNLVEKLSQRPQESVAEQKTVRQTETVSENQKDNKVLVESIKKQITKKPKKVCKYCNTSLNEKAKFCYNCGKSTEEYIVCPCCGAKNFSDATECLLCHGKLD